MNSIQDDIQQLHQRIQKVVDQQLYLSNEINQLKVSLASISARALNSTVENAQSQNTVNAGIRDVEQQLLKIEQVAEPAIETTKNTVTEHSTDTEELANIYKRLEADTKSVQSSIGTKKTSIEKFIGENLINKIGIAVTVIGIAIGTKYSIDHNLISPLARIILGYLLSLAIVVTGIKLRERYTNYSSVLVSGAMAAFYFITFAAYTYYALIPVEVAFGLMTVFTGFTVTAALSYNKQAIAHIGLVGAYAVPFLLHDGSGRVEILLTFVSCVNIGILVIALRKKWLGVFYAAFGLSWLIYISWYSTGYNPDEHYGIALIFSTVFFLIFNVMFVATQFVHANRVLSAGIIVLLVNALCYYLVGYSILDGNVVGNQLLGLFTLSNAVLHFITTVVVYKRIQVQNSLFYVLVCMVLLFVTITIPVQLDGEWIRILWCAEGALLFWIGRSRQVQILERISYPVMLLASFSVGVSWIEYEVAYQLYNSNLVMLTPFVNTKFFTDVFYLFTLCVIATVHTRTRELLQAKYNKNYLQFLNALIYTIPVVVLYVVFFRQISMYWNNLYVATQVASNSGNVFFDAALVHQKSIWLVNYTMLFMLAILLAGMRLKKKALGYSGLVFSVISVLALLTFGLYAINGLIVFHPTTNVVQFASHRIDGLIIRYISFAILAGVLYSIRKLCKQPFMGMNPDSINPLVAISLHGVILWVLSSEVNMWNLLADKTTGFTLGMTLLWGGYAVLLVALGIRQKKQYLRITGFILSGITLLKLFAFDLSDLDTIGKTIVFVTIGALLLVISFLYNKFKHLIADETRSEV